MLSGTAEIDELLFAVPINVDVLRPVQLEFTGAVRRRSHQAQDRWQKDVSHRITSSPREHRRQSHPPPCRSRAATRKIVARAPRDSQQARADIPGSTPPPW